MARHLARWPSRISKELMALLVRRLFSIIGYTTVHAKVDITAHGGWTSGQVLLDFDNMIGHHTPDLVFIQLGANDMGTGVSLATFKANVESIITRTREIKPNSDIVLASTTPTDIFPNRWGGARGHIHGLYQLAVKHQCYFVDLYDVFGTVDTAIWRYDNVHTTIVGGNYVFRHLRDLVFPSIKTAEGYIADARFQVFAGVKQREPLPNKVIFSFDGTGDPVISADDKKYISATASAPGEITVTPSASVRISDAYLLVSPPSSFMIARPNGIFTAGAMRYATINALANPPVLVTSKATLAGSYMVVVFG